MTKLLNVFLLLAGISWVTSAQNLTGTILDGTVGAPIEGATVTLLIDGASTTTGSDGTWALAATDALPNFQQNSLTVPMLHGNKLLFLINKSSENVKIDLFDLSGRLVSPVIDQRLSKGSYSINPVSRELSAEIYLLRVQTGQNITCLKMPVVGRQSYNPVLLKKTDNANLFAAMSKQTQIIDTIAVSKEGYKTAKKAIATYTGAHTMFLEEVVPATDLAVFSESIEDQISYSNTQIYVWDGTTQLQSDYPDAFEGEHGLLVTCGTGTWSGWGWGLTADEGVDMSSWEGGSLHLAIKGDAPSVGVNVTCNVEGATQSVNLADYGYVANGTWYEMDIPFTDFGSLVMTNITYYCSFSAPVQGGAYTAGLTYIVDDIYWKPAP